MNTLDDLSRLAAIADTVPIVVYQYNCFFFVVNDANSARVFDESQDNADYFSVYIGTIINLQKGEKLAVKKRAGWIEYFSTHSFFGIFRIL